MVETISDIFCELILTCDTREKDKERVNSISDFFEARGAIIVNEALSLCDYKIEGSLKGIEVNLGIENKVLTGDFFPSLSDNLAEKLILAHRDYNDVALFIEEGKYAIRETDDGTDAWIQNEGMQRATGQEGIGTLASYLNFCDRMAEIGIHVRQYRTVSHIPITVSTLLKHVIKPIHSSAIIPNREKKFIIDLRNQFVAIPGFGAKLSEKAIKYIPNLEKLCIMQEGELQTIFGKIHGGNIFSFIHNDINCNSCIANYNRDFLDKKKLLEEGKKLIEKSKENSVQKSQETPKQAISNEIIAQPIQNKPAINQSLKGLDVFVKPTRSIEEHIVSCLLIPAELNDVFNHFKSTGYSPEAVMKVFNEMVAAGKIVKLDGKFEMKGRL